MRIFIALCFLLGSHEKRQETQPTFSTFNDVIEGRFDEIISNMRLSNRYYTTETTSRHIPFTATYRAIAGPDYTTDREQSHETAVELNNEAAKELDHTTAREAHSTTTREPDHTTVRTPDQVAARETKHTTAREFDRQTATESNQTTVRAPNRTAAVEPDHATSVSNPAQSNHKQPNYYTTREEYFPLIKKGATTYFSHVMKTETDITARPICTPTCNFGAECTWNAEGHKTCMCVRCSEDSSQGLAVIGSDGYYYGNECWMTYNACERKENIQIKCFSSHFNCSGLCPSAHSNCTCFNDSIRCRDGVSVFPELPYKTVTKYDFKLNSIRYINSTSLKGLEHITELYLDDNKLAALPAELFQNNTNLIALNLNRNRLTTLPRGLFQTNTKLLSLLLCTNRMSVLPESIFSSLHHLQKLSMRQNMLTALPDGLFQNNTNLQRLYLDANRLLGLKESIFSSLHLLQHLSLRVNMLTILPPGLFFNNTNLIILSLSLNKISKLPESIFDRLHRLQILDLSHNSIATLPNKIFAQLEHLRTLYLYGNDIHNTGLEIFGSSPHLSVYSDSFYICCVARGKVDTCEPEPQELSSCENLLDGLHLKISIWVICVLSICFNIVAFVSNVREESMNKVSAFLISQLALADMATGLYLAMIAVVDVIYKEEYFLHDAWWRHSAPCKITGILAVIGSEASVFILVLITVERYVAVVFPHHPNARMTINQARGAALAAWLLTFTLAIVPVCGISYFEEFYSTSTVCLPLPLSSDKPRGWEYAFSVFSVLNILCFLGILIGYSLILRTVHKSRSRISSSQRNTNRSVTNRVLAIILTDFFCWGPLSCMGFLTLRNVDLPTSVFAYVAVFVLPINSALNPFIYSFTSHGSKLIAKQKLERLASILRNLFNRTTRPPTENIEIVAVNNP